MFGNGKASVSVHNNKFLCRYLYYYNTNDCRFTKNLSPDKINISTMKGEGDLSNLELDEVALMEVLDLPTWLRLTKAICNRVAIKVGQSLNYIRRT